jgi:serine/threonine-protein kinase RsbW
MKRGTTLRLKAILENIPKAIDCVSESAEEAGIDEAIVREIQLAVDEACANVVAHAYENSEPGTMEISCRIDEKSLVIQVRDWGRGFVLEDVPDPDVTAPLEERCLGGLGLFLIRQSMDEVDFVSDPEAGNELTMVKRLPVAD